MQVNVTVIDPVPNRTIGVEVSADGVNPIQLILRQEPTWIAHLSPADARRLARALELAADVTPEG